MKCLITGSNGVVGGNLSKLLAEKYNFGVWRCGRTQSNDDNYFTLDLLDREAVVEVFTKNNFDCVIHCAANINMSGNQFELLSNNLNSTLNIIEASLTTGVKKLFHTSSVPVIGKILTLPITEEHPVKPLTSYHLSKLQSEQIIENFCKDKIDYINMRIPSPIGQNMPLRSIFPIFIDKIRRNETIILTGNSNRKQNFLDLRDLAEFIYQASFVDGVSGTFNVAAENSYSNLELAKTMILKLGSNSEIINNMDCNCTELEDWSISTSKAKENFGYISKYDLSETIEWIK